MSQAVFNNREELTLNHKITEVAELSTSFISTDISISKITDFIKTAKHSKHIIICCSSNASKMGIKNILFEYDLSSVDIENYFQIESFTQTYNQKQDEKPLFGIASLKIDNPFEINNVVFISETFIIGKRLQDVKKNIKKDISRLIKQASTLNKGDIVVHRDFGVCIFDGLNTFEALNIKTEMIELSFKGEEKLFIPIEKIGLITKYHQQGLDSNEVQQILDSFTNKTFAKKKKKTSEQIKILADKIIQTAAKRKTSEARMFNHNQTTRKFYESFEYLTTQDQQNAIEDVENDLTAGNQMERLICGDVGFGKTEVAMRAACLVVSGKCEGDYYGQVAIVVPTTILARQHYKNFITRFECINLKAENKIKIAELSRNITQKDQKKILQDLADGKIDIIIGTHGLLSNKTMFKNLDLVIIDEEQHFGVEQKEKLKEGRSNIHFLYLSATPIPRTLNMSLSGLKDISVISTPPINRVNVKTTIMDYDDITIRNSIIRETSRGGRVFFVCPRISDISKQEDYLAKIVPELKYCVAHGQMSGDKIDKIMVDFYEGRYEILLTTTIIESGVDISFANTIIIHNANLFGLSALYQLRGRVGRSGTQAYCYLMINSKQIEQNQDALKRLKAIASITTLGAGFGVATNDMDIRGAGNIIGDQQSGNIQSVGTELYIEMINDAIHKAKSQAIIEKNNQEISKIAIAKEYLSKISKQDRLTIRNNKNQRNEIMQKINNEVQNRKKISQDLISLEQFKGFIPEVKLNISILIPKDYISDYNLRIEFYKKISMCISLDEIYLIQNEMEDRFGKLPSEVSNLIHLIEIRELCHKHFIERLECGDNGLLFSLHQTANQDTVNSVVRAISMINSGFVLKSNNEVLFLSKNTEQNRYDFVKNTIKKIFVC